MSKFWFFDRKGRPTISEKNIAEKLNTFLNEGKISANEVENYLDEYGKPMNETELDEMFGYLTGEYSNGTKYEYAESFDDNDLDYDDTNTESENIINDDSSKKNPIDFNPFEEPVIERGYTRGFQPKQDLDDDLDSENYDDSDLDSDSEDNGVKFSDEDMKIPNDGESIDEIEEDIPEPEWANTGGFTSSVSESDEDDEFDNDEDDEFNEKLGGDNLQDLSPAQKRKSAEKTAEALMSMYCQFVPLPFKKWASISEGKVQKMVFDNKIDLSMELENNVTVKDYIDGTNEQVDEIFTVSDETKEEIKEPLIDVLLEQDLALTPTQRLILAIGGHLVTMSFSAFQLAQNNKQALQTFEKYHNEMNKDKAPAYQKSSTKKTPRPRTQDNLSKVEKQSVEELIRQMENDDVIDSEHDPNVEVIDDYGDDD
jgi:hypothetical protein